MGLWTSDGMDRYVCCFGWIIIDETTEEIVASNGKIYFDYSQDAEQDAQCYKKMLVEKGASNLIIKLTCGSIHAIRSFGDRWFGKENQITIE